MAKIASPAMTCDNSNLVSGIGPKELKEAHFIYICLMFNYGKRVKYADKAIDLLKFNNGGDWLTSSF